MTTWLFSDARRRHSGARVNWPVMLLPLVACCGGDDYPDLFSHDVDQVVLEVDYQPGAEPYTQGNVWSLFAANADALFLAAPREIIVPNTLGEMEPMQDVTQTTFSTEDLIRLSKAYQDDLDTQNKRVFHVMVLAGMLVEQGVPQTEVIGVSLDNTNIIALFKPVLAGAANPLFVEQSSLVHEFGHAIGLVNSGLEMVSAHHDSAHGAHCTNRDCVMYYLHEGRADLVSFLRRYSLTNSPVLFGEECLDDALAAAH